MMLFLAGSTMAAQITVKCTDSSLVRGQSVTVLQYVDKPTPCISEFIVKQGDFKFNDSGSCVVNVDNGDYQFCTLFEKSDGTIVSLTTGKQKVTKDDVITFGMAKECNIRMLYQGGAMSLKSILVRIPGTMRFARWSDSESKKNPPKILLTADQESRVRVIGESSAKGKTVAVIWADLNGNKPDIDLSKGTNYICTFQSLEPAATAATLKNPVATFFLPEGRSRSKEYEDMDINCDTEDLLNIPLTGNPVLITNRKMLEMWYAYETSAGEKITFCRQPYVVSGKYTFYWGGKLYPLAYAWLGYTWIDGSKALIWGANLVNEKGQMVNTPEKAVGLPGDTEMPASANINWTQRLVRKDGKPFKLGNKTPREAPAEGFEQEEYVTKEGFPELYNISEKDHADASELFNVAISYRINGKQVELEVPAEPWVRYDTTHADFLAPRAWYGLALAHLDRTERSWYYGSTEPKADCGYKLKKLNVRWQGLRWQGYSIYSENSRVDLGMCTMRRRRSIYGSDWGPSHEFMHSWGYGHGDSHNKQISRLDRLYRDHHIFLADHPEYEPSPITIDGNKELAIKESDKIKMGAAKAASPLKKTTTTTSKEKSSTSKKK